MTPDFLPLRLEDLETAIDMMSRLYARDNLPWDHGRAETSLRYLLAHPETGGAWFIAVDGAHVGYLVLTICFSLEFAGRFGLVDELYLEPPWRGKGMGAHALAFAEKQGRALGVSALRLEVARDNTRAIALYSRCGYNAHERDLMTKWL